MHLEFNPAPCVQPRRLAAGDGPETKGGPLHLVCAIAAGYITNLVPRAGQGEVEVTMSGQKTIEVENVNHPGKVYRADAQKYEAVKRAFLKVLPKKTPGLTAAEIQERIVAHLPEDLFPNGEKAMWWSKTVQLDLEAKHIVVREKMKPLRWHKA